MATALLIVDMQHIFASMTTSITPQILRLQAHFTSLSLPVIFTRHGHPASELVPPFTNQLVARWGPSGSIALDSPDFQFIPEIAKIAKSPSSILLKGKNTYDAFLNTDLEAILKEKEAERVVVCGVMTDACCDTTARAAFCRGFETWLVDDACGTASEEQHRAGLKGFGAMFGEIVKTDEVVQRIVE